nr:hypothetical protein [uncultured Desulfobacter sp.]
MIPKIQAVEMFTHNRIQFRELDIETTLEEIDLCCRMITTLPLKNHDKNTFWPPLGALKNSFQAAQHSNLLSLVKACIKSLDAGNHKQAISQLNIIASYQPGGHLMQSLLPGDRGIKASDHDRIRLFISDMLQDLKWLAETGEDDLRATLGMHFLTKDYDLSIKLLLGLDWGCIRMPELYLDKLVPLYFNGSAMIVERFIYAVGDQIFDVFGHDINKSLSLGTLSVYVGHNTLAGKSLLPLLKQTINNTEQFLHVVWCLLQADFCEELGAFFSDSDVLDTLMEHLDCEQLLLLYAHLYNSNLLEEAYKIFQVITSDIESLKISELPIFIFGLMFSNRYTEVDQLIRQGISQKQQLQPEKNTVEKMSLAEAFIMTGKFDEAKNILNQISTDRKYGDRHSPKLFLLHLRLSQVDQMSSLLPSIINNEKDITPSNIDYFYLVHLFNNTLEYCLSVIKDNYKLYKQSLGYTNVFFMTLFALGKFSQIRVNIKSNLFYTKGLVSITYFRWAAYLHLAENSFDLAVQSFQHFMKICNKEVLNFNNCGAFSESIFEYILLLRFLGQKEEAFKVARHWVDRNRFFSNQCRPLSFILSRELEHRALNIDEAKECELMADVIWNPVSICQGWLYLHAAIVHSRLGSHSEATRILRTKLANTIFLAPDHRKMLLTASGKDIISLRDPLQKMFFPHYKNTYWNQLIDKSLS